MKKRLLCLVMALAMITTAFCITSTSSAITDAEFVAPVIEIPEYLKITDSDLITDNQTVILAEGTRHEQTLTSEFIVEGQANRPTSVNGVYNYQRYVLIHNTGAYPSTSTALANHNYGRGGSAEVSWHFTCGNDGIYQMIPINEKGWHAGGNYWTDSTIGDKLENCSNSTTVGIETATPGFPADNNFSGEHWDSDELYEWYEVTFDKTATYLAILVATLFVKMNFNPYTQLATHYQSAAKNCPMQMRYIFGTNAQFTIDGTYFKVFKDRMYDYYEALGGSYLPTDTFYNIYYNPTNKVYSTGLYKATADLTVYRAGNTSTEVVGTVSADEVVDVTVASWQWGKITLTDGTKGWINLDTNVEFVTGEYDYGTYRTAEGEIVNVTAIDGTTATYEGGTADITTLTRVYKVTVEGDTAFGSEPKYLASGDTFEVTAVPAVAPMLFDIWEVSYGAASIEEKTAETTTITVLDCDVTVKATYRDKYDLFVESGTGSGRYAVGDAVTVTARASIGKTFVSWAIESGAGTFADATAFSTTFTMGEADTVIYAIYEDAVNFDLTGLTNYALNKSYVYEWKDMTGSNIAWYNAIFMRDVDSVILTDGVCEDDNSYSLDDKFAAVVGTEGTGVITVDLGANYNVNRIVIRDFVIQSSWGDIQNLAVTTSTDGVNFVGVESFTDSLYHSFEYDEEEEEYVKISETLYTHCVDFVPAEARYVRLTYKSSKYVTAFTEVEVYGAEGQNPPAPPVDDPSEEPSEDPSEDPSSGDSDVTSDEPVEAVYGDVNGDNEINSLDAAQTLKYDAMMIELSEVALVAADVNGDGSANSLDAAQILKYDAMMITEFPVEAQ
ncbi:MAG: N-acetylmuramoyl-L-alanine amidase [Clostridia bacterium]|nr:N-acetylmuramoyl-L-alanine amidase [Clostridia bacterium]